MIRLHSRLKHPFHVALASTPWLQMLEKHVSNRIKELGGFDTRDGEGDVSSRYGEDRFMGLTTHFSIHRDRPAPPSWWRQKISHDWITLR